MRIWSVHPQYLDAKGLVALWREALLAQAVLSGKTKGYRHHPQLRRFQDQLLPVAAIAQYLRSVHKEATRRGYRFDATKIDGAAGARRIAVTRGQMQYEFCRLLEKLSVRHPDRYANLAKIANPEPHPLFRVIGGNVEPWEKTDANSVYRAKTGATK